MKLLIIGSGGMLGHVLTFYLTEMGYEVIDVSRKRKCRKETILIDVLDVNSFSDFLKHNSFDMIINCAAILPKNAMKTPSLTVLVNSYFPHFLEEFYRNTDTKIIQVSTGGVFCGDNAPYYENSKHDTSNFYGKTKSLGELVDKNNLTVRSDYIGPDMSKEGNGLFNWIMQTKGNVHGYNKVFFNGVSSLEFAKFIDLAIHKNITGIYHLHSSNTISKAEFLKLVCVRFNRKGVNIIDDDVLTMNTSLVTERRDIIYVPSSLKEQIDTIYDWVNRHNELYPHYFEGVLT